MIFLENPQGKTGNTRILHRANGITTNKERLHFSMLKTLPKDGDHPPMLDCEEAEMALPV